MNQNKTTSAGKWSVALALIPIVISVSFLLLVMVPMWTGRVSGEGGLGVMIAIGQILYFGAHALFVTSLLGAVLALFAICKTKWQKGVAGLVLNISVFLLAGSYLSMTYHRINADPDRLNIAVLHGDIATVEKLLDGGFDINHKYTQGETPLHEAMGNPEMAKLLISRGADVNAVDQDGRTPLFCLAALGTLGTTSIKSKEATFELADLLIQHGAKIEARSTSSSRTPAEGCTPLHAAADANNLLMIEKLLMAGANINALNDEGWTPLALAARDGHIEAARLLIEKRADIALSGKNVGYCPLLAAIRSGKTQMVEYLLKAGSDPNVEDSSGAGALHAAADSTQDRNSGQEIGTDILSILIRAGADVNKIDHSGRTPLNFALSYPRAGTSQKAVAQMLLEKGAVLDFINPQGRLATCLDTVREWKVQTEEQKKCRDEIISLLERYK